MRQVLQSLSDGVTSVAEVPMPAPPRRGLLIATTRSLISAGTERMLVDFGRAGWIDKARQQPEKVRQVLDKIRTDGLLPTLDAVRSKLDQPLALGYCNVGIVRSVGADARGFTVGDRVVSNGPHAEAVAVPANLCARIPDGVSDDEATFAVLGAIALQGLRLAAPTMGERFVVTGLGLLGLIAVQLLRANGCRVLGIDPDPAKAELARAFGAEVVPAGADPVAAAQAFTHGDGVDGVIITAATRSNEPMSQAAAMSRKRGRIVLVGVTGLELDRAAFYQKELSFQVSCSYGPGRYDPDYEERGHDYPFGFVRWTAQRNFQAILDLMAGGRLDVKPLMSHRFALADAPRAYDLLAGGAQPYLGIVLEYDAGRGEPVAEARQVVLRPVAASREQPGLAVIGSGNYAGRVLIPAMAQTGARLVGIASGGGVSAAHFGRKYGFEEATTDADALIRRDDVDAVVVATRHDSHPAYVQAALLAGKHVFVEKPLAIAMPAIDAIEARLRDAAAATQPMLMVGFNRRFAPHTRRIVDLLAPLREPKSFVVTVNAGQIPATHWTQDSQVGGGRLIGEACHFIDLLRFLAGCAIVHSHVARLRSAASPSADDTLVITLGFADGSVGSINYFANGSAAFPKERVEVFCAGRVLQLDNFRRLRGFGWPGFRSMNLWSQDKGQKACAAAFVQALRSGGPSPIPLDEILEVSRVTVTLGEAARA